MGPASIIIVSTLNAVMLLKKKINNSLANSSYAALVISQQLVQVRVIMCKSGASINIKQVIIRLAQRKPTSMKNAFW